MLKRILAWLAVASLLAAGVLLVYWWRSNHGYTDHLLTLGKGETTQTVFTSNRSRVQMEVTDHFQNLVTSRMQFLLYQNLIAYCLIVPALWFAITLRRWLGKKIAARTRT